MKRVLSLLLVVGLIAVLAVPVSAVEGSAGGWIELLETSSVQANGLNRFTVSGTSGSFSVPVDPEARLGKIDMLISYSGGILTSVNVNYAGSTTPLTIVDLGNNICRVFGDIAFAFYADVNFTVQKSTTGTGYYQILSCKASTLKVIDYVADAYLARHFGDPSPLKCPANFSVPYNYDEPNMNSSTLIPVTVKDWRKYDSVTLFGSLGSVALNSFRASVGNKGLPFEITYTVSNSTGSSSTNYEWSELKHYTYDGDSYKGSTEGQIFTNTEYSTSLLYTITIDLSGVDRTLSGDLACFFTLSTNAYYGYSVNVQAVSGSVTIADTSSVSWWNRFTGFMNGLFGGKDPGALDDLGDSSNSISSNTDQIHGFEQSQQAVLDNNFAQIQGAISFTNFAAALVFVQKYTNMTFNGISKYAIVFTLPLFLGLFFYLCSRIPGITRWKTPPPRSPSPKSKGGGKP